MSHLLTSLMTRQLLPLIAGPGYMFVVCNSLFLVILTILL